MLPGWNLFLKSNCFRFLDEDNLIVSVIKTKEFTRLYKYSTKGVEGESFEVQKQAHATAFELRYCPKCGL